MLNNHSAVRFRFATFTLDLSRASLREGDREIALRPKPFSLLVYLLENPDRLVTKDELMTALWPNVVVTEDSLTRCVSEMRAALGHSGPEAIRTVSRRGYRFVLPVEVQGSESTEPPSPAMHQRARTNLPDAMPAPIGREQQLLELDGLLATHRVVTLVGPGGVGKSCLAQWLLHDRRDRLAHGVAWVDLSALTETQQVAASISAALGLHAGAGNPVDALLGALQPLQMLVALDNAEHLIEEVARVVQLVHDNAPGIRIIVTSQAPLRVQAEVVYRLDTLAVPQSDATISGARGHGAFDLFVQRATAADARFALTEETVGPAIRICAELDGLPLSIELAAARAPMLGTVALAGMLGERFRVLTAGRRSAPDRQQSLRATMEWSHGLLDEPEQLAFRRLGVFSGSFSLDAAQHVLADASLDRWGTFEALGDLVERSLVVAARSEPTRYRLLETTHAFAVEQLVASGEDQVLRRRHAAAFESSFRSAYDDYFVGRQTVERWREPLLADLDNGRAALAWAIVNDPAVAVSLAASMALVASSERPRERRGFLDATRAFVDTDLPAGLCARWFVEAAFDLGASKPALARQFALRAIRAFRSSGDAVGLYRSLSILLYCDPIDPQDTQQSELEELQSIENPQWPAVVRAQGAHAAACWFSARGDFASAIVYRQRTLALYEQASSPWQVLVAQANLMDSLLASGRVDEAIATGAALEARLRGTRRLSALPAARLNLAAALLFRGDLDQAKRVALEGWPQATRLGWQPYWADYLALLAALESRPRTAARLLGCANARYALEGTQREVNEARAASLVERCLEADLTPGEVEHLLTEGAELSDSEVSAIAFVSQDAVGGHG